MLAGIAAPLLSVIEKIIPNPQAADAAKLELLKLEQAGELDTLKTVLQPFINESANEDKWTSRARPSFMYVMYIMILTAIPMGVLYIFSPDSAKNFGLGVQFWLNAIPKQLWDIFGLCFSVYAVARTHEKQPFFGGK